MCAGVAGETREQKSRGEPCFRTENSIENPLFSLMNSSDARVDREKNKLPWMCASRILSFSLSHGNSRDNKDVWNGTECSDVSKTRNAHAQIRTHLFLVSISPFVCCQLFCFPLFCSYHEDSHSFEFICKRADLILTTNSTELEEVEKNQTCQQVYLT